MTTNRPAPAPATPARVRLTEHQREALLSGITSGPVGAIHPMTGLRTGESLQRRGLVAWSDNQWVLTDAGRAAVGHPTPAAAVAALVAIDDQRPADDDTDQGITVALSDTDAVNARWAALADDQAAVDQAEALVVDATRVADETAALADDTAALVVDVDAAVGAAIARRETADGAPRLLPIGTRVRTDDDRTGTVVAGSLWTVSVAEGRDPGDRVVSMDVTGERLVWDRRFLTVLDDDQAADQAATAATPAPVGDQAPRVLVADHADAIVRGSAFVGQDHQRVTVPAGTVVSVLPHPVPAYVSLVGETGGQPFLFVVRAEHLDTVAPVASDDTDVMGEARGWLADCGLPTGGDDAAIVARVGREYDGGWSAFLAATVPAPGAAHGPAVSCPAVWTGGLVCTRDDDHGDDDHRTTLFGRPVTFTYGTSAPVAQDTPAVAAETPAATSGRARSAERTEFLSDVLCAALEGGIGYWSAADDIVRVSEATGQPCGSDAWPWRYDAVTLYEIGDDDDECSVTDGPCQGHRVTLDTIATAVNRISKTKRDACPDAGGFAYRYVTAVRDASIENDGGEIDADVADIVVQVAALGSVVYG